MSDTKELMNTAMEHNRKLLSTVLRESAARTLPSPAIPQPAGPGLPSAAPTVMDRKAILDRQFGEQVKKLQKKYVGKLSPKRMNELHAQASSSLATGSALAPSSASVLRRALSSAMPAPTAGTLETSAPFTNSQ